MYGETVGRLREGFAELLRQHRVQQRIGGRGTYTVTATTTPAERAEIGRSIRIYRQAVLAWCTQTAHAIDPCVVSNLAHLPANPFIAAAERDLGPLYSLKHALKATTEASTARLPTLDELTTPNQVDMVESWRHLARAAALAEHDITRIGRGQRSLSLGQALAVTGDIATITQALIVLDNRYDNIPDWEPLRNIGTLGWAALACALDANLGAPDFSVDQQGWRPPVKTIKGPGKPGLLGVLQAEHNLTVRLRTPPSALNLRLVVDSQRLLSAGLVTHAGPVDPALAQQWQEREHTYTLLQRALRGINGVVGRGGLAAAEGANAVSRLRPIPTGHRVEPRLLAGFVTLFDRVDNRVADILDHALTRGHFFERVALPQIDDDTTKLVRPLQQGYRPVTADTRTRLRAIGQDRLRGGTEEAAPSAEAARSRADLQAALIHHPPTRAAGPYVSM
ncbi:hypothetical protein [Nocardioides sp. AN3]